MYEEFYGLKQRPFSKTPDPHFLFLSRNHEEALARLQYAVEEKDLILLTGDVGSGKTTLTRALMDYTRRTIPGHCDHQPAVDPGSVPEDCCKTLRY